MFLSQGMFCLYLFHLFCSSATRTIIRILTTIFIKYIPISKLLKYLQFLDYKIPVLSIL